MGARGVTEVDFGAFPGTSHATVAVTGQTGILSTSLVEAWLAPADTADHSSDEHVVEKPQLHVVAADIVPSTGFTIHAVYQPAGLEPLTAPSPSTFRSAATSVYGYIAPTEGGRAPTIWGKWKVGWVWVD